MVHLRGWSGRDEELWAKIVFMCMVAAILIGGPLAGLWVSRFGKKAVGLGKNVDAMSVPRAS
jgi:hypothetical protein